MPKSTRNSIITSFIFLLNEYSFDKITVKKITDHCGINRNTFYYYYQDVYDLLEKILLSILEEAKAVMLRSNRWEQGILFLMQYFQNNRRALYHVYHSLGTAKIIHFLTITCDDILKEYISHQAIPVSPDPRDRELIHSFYLYGLLGILFQWIEKGMKEDPRLLTEDLSRLLKGSIVHAYGNSTPKR